MSRPSYLPQWILRTETRWRAFATAVALMTAALDVSDTALADVPPSEYPDDGPRLLIVSPLDGEIVALNKQVTIEATFDPPIGLDSLPVEAEIEAVGDHGKIPIAAGDLRLFSRPDFIGTDWDPSGVPAGDYRLVVRVTRARIRAEAAVQVRVHPVPIARPKLSYIEAGKEGIEVGFGVDVRSPNQTPISEYLWVAGNARAPERTEAPEFSHLYPSTGGEFIVWLEARDALGGTYLTSRRLHLPPDLPHGYRLLPVHSETAGVVFVPEHYDIPFHPIPEDNLFKAQAPICGCSTMTIEANPRERSRLYCAPKGNKGAVARAGLEQEGCLQRERIAIGTCPPQHVAYDCPLGQHFPPPILGWGFEVVARLDPKTTDQGACQQGQYARGDVKLVGVQTAVVPDSTEITPLVDPQNPTVTLQGGKNGSFAFDVVPNQDPYPGFTDTKYGADDYTNEKLRKRHRPQGLFYWYDQPKVIRRNVAGITSIEQNKEFVAFVNGSPGLPNCWCRFTVEQLWRNGTGGDPGNAITIKDGESCVAGPGVQKD